jgi:hypothetical protein
LFEFFKEGLQEKMGHFLEPSIVYEYNKLASERGTKSFLKTGSVHPRTLPPYPPLLLKSTTFLKINLNTFFFCFRHSLATECPTFFDEETGVLEAPMVIRVADQVSLIFNHGGRSSVGHLENVSCLVRRGRGEVVHSQGLLLAERIG